MDNYINPLVWSPMHNLKKHETGYMYALGFFEVPTCKYWVITYGYNIITK